MKNEILMQYFEWYLPEDGRLWKQITNKAKRLANAGITKIWMPPAYKGQGGQSDVGYGVYDMYDLGEFDQKGTMATKYGTKDEYLEAIAACHRCGIEVIADIVFDHRMGADAKEKIKARFMSWSNHEQPISDEDTVEVWTKYTFPNRKGKYSDFVWDWTCFDGADYDALSQRSGLLKFDTKKWDDNVSGENGNFDYIMGDDLDFSEEKVRRELMNWGKWYYEFTGVDGYRLDAVKSIDSHFFPEWLGQQRNIAKKNSFAVGEYWTGNTDEILDYLNESDHCMTAFDVPLHFRLFDASNSFDQYDMSTILDNTLTQRAPQSAVAFVDNHDTQPQQALESWVQPWFKIHAYALVLLYKCLYPCIFYGDVYGIEHNGIQPVEYLKEMCWVRSRLMEDGFDENVDGYFNDSHCIGWIVRGTWPVVVVMTNGAGNAKNIYVGDEGTYIDIVTKRKVIAAYGSGCFECQDGGCSIYIPEPCYQTLQEYMDET